MFELRTFIGNRISTEFQNACNAVQVNSTLMNEALINDIREFANGIDNPNEYDVIRAIHAQFKDRNYITSHLSALFGKKKSLISKIIRDPQRGERPTGRRRILSEAEENTVIDYVRECQRQGRCVTATMLTKYINEYIIPEVPGREPVSPWFVLKNERIMENFELGVPQQVEEIRIEASTYENIAPFYARLAEMYNSHTYDPDLIINVDETTTFAEKSKRSTLVLFDPTINIRPMAVVEPKQEHITLCCGVSASGRHLTPSFIIKNKTVTVEDCLFSLEFGCGEYGIAHSPNGWQDSVSFLS